MKKKPASYIAHESRRRVAYFMRRFPVLSETFIQREILALRELGLDVLTLAEFPDDVDMLGERARAMMHESIYLRSLEQRHFRRRWLRFLWRDPVRLRRLQGRVVQQNYGRHKSPQGDRDVLRRILCLAELLRKREVHHVHAPWAGFNAFVAAQAAELAGLPFSLQARAYEIHCVPEMHLLREKFRAARFIVTNTRYNATHLRTLMEESDRPKITVIHNGLDLREFVPPPRPPTATATTRILTVARLVEQKGLPYLLEACALLMGRGYAFHLTVIGAASEDRDPDTLRRLEELHQRLNLENHVRFVGGQPFEVVRQAYDDHDLFVLPCVIASDGGRDIIPNALIEAMAMQLPVISTPVGGIPEMIEDGKSGVVVPSGQAEPLAMAMAALIDDPPRRAALGAAARRRVEEKFDIRKNAVAYRDLFLSGGVTSAGGPAAG